MKFPKSFFGLILGITLVACSNDDPITMEPDADTQNPLVELQFTDPPIALQGADAQFAPDIPYDVFDKTKFDIFLPNSESPTGLVIFIHGGGFTGGDKAFLYTSKFEAAVVELLHSKVAVATINYRLVTAGDTEGVLKSLNDSKRALQYMRYLHNELNINKENIVLFGTSAGASTAFWLATNDDFRDLNGADIVAQESSRVKGIALNATQSSLDIETRWLDDVFVEFGTSLDDIIQEVGEETTYNFYGVSTQEAYESPEIEGVPCTSGHAFPLVIG